MKKKLLKLLILLIFFSGGNSVRSNEKIVLPKNHQDSLNVYLTSDVIRDFYGNTLIDSVLQVKDCNNNSYDSVDTKFQSGGLYGEVLTSSNKDLVIAAYNIETKEPWLTIAENNYFSFSSLPAGEYFLQAYENYTMESEVVYPYFAGSWNPFKGSVNFSEIIGPVEIRKNWDIDGIKIKFD